jgi:DNA-binding response OmpR family regulator
MVRETVERAGRVLVVDDTATVREVVARYLERDGFIVDSAADVRTARTLMRNKPDLVVLDIVLPDGNGLDLLRELRATRDVPVILLTARSDETDRIVGLELGGDDYIVKPFSPRELAVRVRTVLRRSRTRPVVPRLEFDGLAIDMVAREITVRGKPVDTRAREFDLLAFLASSPRQVFSRGQLLEQVWNSDPAFHDLSTVTVHIRRLRQRIERDPLRPRWITTIWGVGYRFEP